MELSIHEGHNSFSNIKKQQDKQLKFLDDTCDTVIMEYCRCLQYSYLDSTVFIHTLFII